MRTMLDRVEKEKSLVEQAVKDLNDANAQVEQSALYRLRQGGLPKQLTFVGCVLFVGRSLADTISAVTGNDEALLASALAQGLIALVCAIAFFFL